MKEPELKRIKIPAGPRCKRCGHSVCPFCRTWCDVMVHVIDELDGDDFEPCCGGECELDAAAVELWRSTLPDEAFHFGTVLEISESEG